MTRRGFLARLAAVPAAVAAAPLLPESLFKIRFRESAYDWHEYGVSFEVILPKVAEALARQSVLYQARLFDS